MAENLSKRLSLIPDARMRNALLGIVDGAPTTGPEFFSLGTPGVADADWLIKDATGTELPNTETVTYLASATDASPHDGLATVTTVNGVAVWDVRDKATYGRNLVSVVSHGGTAVTMTILISGFDYLGQAMSELHTVTNAAKTATGKKAFAYVRSVAITAAADAEANTLTIGTGSALGLPFKLEKIGHVVAASLAGVQELINVASNATVVAAVTTSPATTTTGDVRGTITLTGTLNGTAEAMIGYYVSARNTAGIHGVVQV
jgi:hypothetical protein